MKNGLMIFVALSAVALPTLFAAQDEHEPLPVEFRMGVPIETVILHDYRATNPIQNWVDASSIAGYDETNQPTEWFGQPAAPTLTVPAGKIARPMTTLKMGPGSVPITWSIQWQQPDGSWLQETATNPEGDGWDGALPTTAWYVPGGTTIRIENTLPATPPHFRRGLLVFGIFHEDIR